MKLYYAPGACSLSPHIVLEEAGLPYKAVRADLKTKQTETGADFKSTNPLGYVPALELDDGSVLTEGPAIVQYIADKVPAKNLAPANGTMERYKLQSALNFVSTEMHKGFSPLFNPAMPDDAKKIAKERLATRLAHLDKHFAGSQYLAGGSYSVADAYLFTVLNWAKPTGVDLSAYPNVVAYHGRVAGRPAVQAAMKQEGLIK
ncbi:MAG: glutathione transferase GstA [Hyphomicrobiales bacterium]|nr:glutathione transferase GstA [Hyphomicrobiales bacterium]